MTQKGNKERHEKCRFESPTAQIGYAQMCHLLAYDDQISHGAYRAYAVLVSFAMQKDHCFPGVERLAEILGCSRRTVSAYLKELKGRGLIRRQRDRFNAPITTIICDLDEAYGNDPVTARFERLSGRAHGGEVDFPTDEKQASPQPGSELPVSGEVDFPTDGKQASPEEEKEKKKKLKKKKEEETSPDGEKIPETPGIDLTGWFGAAQTTEEKQEEFRKRGLDAEGVADPHAVGSLVDDIIRIHRQTLATGMVEGQELKTWRKGWNKLIEDCCATHAQAKQAMEAMADLKNPEWAWGWENRAYNTPYNTKFQADFSIVVGRIKAGGNGYDGRGSDGSKTDRSRGGDGSGADKIPTISGAKAERFQRLLDERKRRTGRSPP